jgi:acetyl-CoA acetyltransferase
MRDVVVVSAVRTAIGTFGGSLKDVPPIELGTTVVREALSRAQVNGADVGHVVFGHVVNTEPKDMYLSRVAAIQAGCGQETPAFNVNRLCGSGLQAIVSAAQSIQLGDCDIAIGGGAENMSRAPFASLNMRWGSRMGDTKMVDMMVGALHDPFQTIHMGVTAENIAKSGASPAMTKMLWHWRATCVPSAPPRKVGSQTKSCPSCSKPAKGTWPMPPTNTSELGPQRKTFPNSNPSSSKKTER